MYQPVFLDASANVLIAFAGVATTVGASAAIYYSYLTSQMRRLVEVQTLHAVFERMEKDRPARTQVRDYMAQCKSEGRPFSPIEDENVKKAIDSVCRNYDLLGFMDRHELLSRHYIDEFYSVPLVFLYDDILGQYVDSLRQERERGATHFWELTQFYQRVKDVPPNHPSRTAGATKWTKHRERTQEPTQP